MHVQTMLTSLLVSDLQIVESRHENVGPSIMASFRECLKNHHVDNPEGLLGELQKRVEKELRLTQYGTLLQMNGRLRNLETQMWTFREEFNTLNLERRIMSLNDELSTTVHKTLMQLRDHIEILLNNAEIRLAKMRREIMGHDIA